jgi:hypothetical protein
MAASNLLTPQMRMPVSAIWDLSTRSVAAVYELLDNYRRRCDACLRSLRISFPLIYCNHTTKRSIRVLLLGEEQT